MQTGESLIGTVLGDRYRIESLLGAGGMGAVFRARPTNGEQALALKVLRPGDESSILLPRFLREARLAARIRHAHVVRVLGFGRWGEHRDRYYLAMELVDGVSLEALLDADLPAGACVSLACQILDALSHVHARGILHRDVKPDNVLVSRTPDGALTAKVADFGIAAAFADDESTRLTQEGTALGTPAYMAPEQAEGRVLVGPTIDLYPVGVILYRMLAGRLPFEGPLARVLLAKITEEPAPLHPRPGLDIPPGLTAVIMKLLARQPEHRYALAPDARRDLLPFCEAIRLSDSQWRSHGGKLRGSTSEADITMAAEGRDAIPGTAEATEHGKGPQGTLVGDIQRAELDDRERFWGRAEELARLKAIAADSEQGRGQVVIVDGESGIGKSTLVHRLAVELAEDGRFQVLRAGYHRAAGSGDGVRMAVDRLLGTTGKGPEQVRQAARELLRLHGEHDEHEVGELVDFLRPDAAKPTEDSDRQSRNFAIALRLLRRIAHVRPALLVLDDVDAGGPDAASFIAYVLFEASMEPFPMLLVATCRDRRDDAFDRALARSGQYEGSARHGIRLGPLGERDLMLGLAHEVGLPSTVAREIALRSGGNPLFALHLARAAANHEQLPSTSTLPRSLQEILESAIDESLQRSSHPQRIGEVLSHVAVLGMQVHVDVLQACLGEMAELDDAIDELLELGLLREDDAAGNVLGFANVLVREALLETVAPRKARRLHRKAAEILAAGGHGSDDAGAIGDHFEAAGDRPAAVIWWLRAVEREILAGEAMRGVHWGFRALDVMNPADPAGSELAIRLGRLLLDAGDLERAEQVLMPVVDGEDADAALCAGEVLVDLYENQGRGATWAKLMERMNALTPQASPRGLRALYHARALALNYQGQHDLALADTRRALELADGVDSSVRAALRHAFILASHCRTDEAVAIAERAVAEAGGASDLLARGLRVLGVIYGIAGRPDDALATHLRVLDLCRRTGRSARVPIAFHDIAAAYAQLGDPKSARHHLREAVRLGSELGTDNVVVFSKLKLVTYDLLDGRTEGPLEAIEECMQAAERAGMKMIRGFSAPLRGWAHLVRGEYEEARQEIAAADTSARPRLVEVAQAIEGLGVALSRVTLEARADFAPEARRFLSFAAELWTNLRDSSRTEHCRAALARLEKDQPLREPR